jgi:hypothetical protein
MIVNARGLKNWIELENLQNISIVLRVNVDQNEKERNTVLLSHDQALDLIMKLAKIAREM